MERVEQRQKFGTSKTRRVGSCQARHSAAIKRAETTLVRFFPSVLAIRTTSFLPRRIEGEGMWRSRV